MFDACVLANQKVINLLLTLARAEGSLFTPLWSEQIIEETYRTHTGPLNWNLQFARSFRAALLRNFPESLVSGYEQWIGQCTNDEKDRHVLACAIEGGAGVIVTYNLRDFGDEHLSPWRVRALHPQDFLLELYTKLPNRVMGGLKGVAQNRSWKLGREVTVEEELAALAPFVPKFSQALLAVLKRRPRA
ncbi:PIN domain-containing protein [Cephaloticoccus primus]|uniref:PIN domain-containing protein n=1 Tax=Cephaloticoccus primus TaxID=1548207 RepID=UPI0018D36546|nr:PIN domain-containing protein [Cephaloticoccus primus]